MFATGDNSDHISPPPGQVLIVAALLLIIIGIPVMILLLIFRKSSRRKTAAVSLTIALWSLAYVSVTESLNCFMLYGCTRFSQLYFTQADHDSAQLLELYGLLIEKTNALAEQVPRDSDDRFTLTIDPEEAARSAMKAAAEDYPQLSGYYPKPKPIQFSYFMSQSNLLGMYFPFTMEANYNDDMVRTNLPDTLCHELAHLKGFIQEDEANFIAFVASKESPEPQVQYSGYLRALEYVRNQVVRSNTPGAEELTEQISDKVRRDWFRFMPDTYWEDNKKKEIIPTERGAFHLRAGGKGAAFGKVAEQENVLELAEHCRLQRCHRCQPEAQRRGGGHRALHRRCGAAAGLLLPG